MKPKDQSIVEGLRLILGALPVDKKRGTPYFTTPYQLAIEFNKRFRAEFDGVGLPVGGKGTGDSFAWYVSDLLAHGIAEGTITDIEIQFYDASFVAKLACESDEGRVIPTTIGSQRRLTLLRLKQATSAQPTAS